MESEVNRNIEEQLSAFLDGELSADELQLLVRRLERNDEYRATLARWASIGGMLRNDQSQQLADKLRVNVLHALEHDGVVEDASAEGPLMAQPWFKPAIAAAVSAVAVAALLTANLVPFPTSGPSAAPQDVASIANVTSSPAIPANLTSSPSRSVQADAAPVINNERMLSYLLSHGEYARPFQGTLMDSRVFVQQASFEE